MICSQAAGVTLWTCSCRCTQESNFSCIIYWDRLCVCNRDAPWRALFRTDAQTYLILYVSLFIHIWLVHVRDLIHSAWNLSLGRGGLIFRPTGISAYSNASVCKYSTCNMYMYVYKCVYICIYMCVYIYICIYMISVRIHILLGVYTSVSVCHDMYVCMHVRWHIQLSMCNMSCKIVLYEVLMLGWMHIFKGHEQLNSMYIIRPTYMCMKCI